MRFNGDQPSGTSRFGKVGMLQVAYTFPNTRDSQDWCCRYFVTSAPELAVQRLRH